MQDSSKWTVVVLLVWLQAAAPGNAFKILSKYERRVNLLKDVMTHDTFWRYVLNQHVYFDFDRRYYPHVIDDELLDGARGEPQPVATAGDKVPAETGEPSAVPPKPVGEPVVPIRFIRNLFARRFHINSLVNVGLRLLHVAFKCLVYKHVSHLLTLVQKQISRTSEQKKAISWSNKSRESVGWIVVKMGSIQLSDELLLLAMSFFRVYDKPTLLKTGNRFAFVPKLTYLASRMREFIAINCLRDTPTDKDITTELKLKVTPALYGGIQSKGISDVDFKDMITESKKKISEHINKLPETRSAMPTVRWNELLRYKEMSLEELEEENDMMWNINR